MSITPQQEVADFIEIKKKSFAAFSIGIMVTTEPIFAYLKSFFRYDMYQVTLPSVINPQVSITIPGIIDRNIGGGHSLKLEDSIKFLDQNNAARYEFLTTIGGGMILSIGDRFAKYDYFTKTPELLFLRHLRNGIAHGNKFDIRTSSGKFWKEAKFRNLEIKSSLNGHKVLGEFIQMGDVMMLFDYLENELRPGSYD